MNGPDPLATQIAEGFLLWFFGGVTQPFVIPQTKLLHLAIRKDVIPFSKRFIAHLYAVKGESEYISSGAKTPSDVPTAGASRSAFRPHLSIAERVRSSLHGFRTWS